MNNILDWAFPLVAILLLGGFLFAASQPDRMHSWFGGTNEAPATEPVHEVFMTLEPPFSFEEIFYEIRRIDTLYGTDFRNESPTTGVLREQAAKQYLNAIEQLRRAIANQTVPEEDEYIQEFLNARENMLLFGIYYQRAMAIGVNGVFRPTHNCEDRENILQATYLFNQTRHYGGRAMFNFDLALRYKPARPLIGIGETKPAIYSPAFRDMGDLIETNLQGLDQFCYPEA